MVARAMHRWGRRFNLFDTAVIVVLLLLGVIFLFPILYEIAMSLTPFSEVLKNGGFLVIPRRITFDAYMELFRQPQIPRSLWVTTQVTVIGTAINMVLTILLAYVLSRKHLPGRKFFLAYIVFTMLFSGGMIPTYLLVKDLKLLNTIWAMILPNAIWTYNTLIMKSFFEGVPDSLFEAAHIDGAGDLRVLVRILLPVSMPVLTTVGLFYLVSHWNELMQAIMYITKPAYYPLQVVVRQILIQSRNVMNNPDVSIPTETIQAAIVIFASAPVIILYPFLQKHFAKGMMLGAIKG